MCSVPAVQQPADSNLMFEAETMNSNSRLGRFSELSPFREGPAFPSFHVALMWPLIVNWSRICEAY